MDMKKMMKQAQKMQNELNRVQEEVKQMEFSATAGGGMVTAVMMGTGMLKEITIDPEALDPEDVDMLQDMIVAAVNEAHRDMEEIGQARISAVTGGMGLPGL